METQETYWNERYRREGRIWGDSPSKTAVHAAGLFRAYGAASLLVPGAEIGRAHV